MQTQAELFSNDCGMILHLGTSAATAHISCLSTFHGRRTFLSVRDATDPKLRTSTAVPYPPCGTRYSDW